MIDANLNLVSGRPFRPFVHLQVVERKVESKDDASLKVYIPDKMYDQKDRLHAIAKMT